MQAFSRRLTLALMFAFASAVPAHFVRSQDKIPTFTLACSAYGGADLYRITSNSLDIFFGSPIMLRDTGPYKADIIHLEDRKIRFKLGDARDYSNGTLAGTMIIYRDTLQVDYADPDLRFRLECQFVEESHTFIEYKNSYYYWYEKALNSRGKLDLQQKEYNNRLNKI